MNFWLSLTGAKPGLNYSKKLLRKIPKKCQKNPKNNPIIFNQNPIYFLNESKIRYTLGRSYLPFGPKFNKIGFILLFTYAYIRNYFMSHYMNPLSNPTEHRFWKYLSSNLRLAVLIVYSGGAYKKVCMLFTAGNFKYTNIRFLRSLILRISSRLKFRQ